MLTIGQAVAIAILGSLLWGVATLALAPERLHEAFEVENERAIQWFGEQRTMAMRDRARALARAIMPDQEELGAPKQERQVSVVKGQVRDVRMIVEQSIFRGQAVLWVMLIMSPMLVAVAIDGVVVRMKKSEQMHSENPRVYHMAKHALFGVMLAPILIATIPVGLGPPMAVAWGSLVILTIWGMAQNVEREI